MALRIPKRCQMEWTLKDSRHGRPRPGHPRPCGLDKKDVDTRHKAGHDEFLAPHLMVRDGASAPPHHEGTVGVSCDGSSFPTDPHPEEPRTARRLEGWPQAHDSNARQEAHT